MSVHFCDCHTQMTTAMSSQLHTFSHYCVTLRCISTLFAFFVHHFAYAPRSILLAQRTRIGVCALSAFQSQPHFLRCELEKGICLVISRMDYHVYLSQSEEDYYASHLTPIPLAVNSKWDAAHP